MDNDGTIVDVTTHQLPWHTASHQRQRAFAQSAKLQDVLYEIRGPVHQHAARLEAEGHRILKLNIGNPAPFGFEAPDVIMRDIIQALPYAQGVLRLAGHPVGPACGGHALRAGARISRFDVDDVYLGNGVSELITMTLQALLDNGDQVLIPSPDYPLWTASTSLAGGTPVHYLCDETQGWQPDIADLESKITERTKALVVINPNNPTGAVYSCEILTQMVDLARKHQLLLLADEIYDKILYDDAKHISLASIAPDMLCLTFNGLSKAYRVAGYRAGWLAITGPKEHASSFIEGIGLLANMRLCPNVPAQHAIQVALGGHQSIEDLVLPGGRLLEQRDIAWTKLNEIPGCRASNRRARCMRFPARPRGLRHRRRRATRARSAAVGEDPGHPGHRVQLARTGSSAPGDAAMVPRSGGRHRAAG